MTSSRDPIPAALERARAVAETWRATPPPAPLSETVRMLAHTAERSALEARIVEPHLDALVILDECPDPVDLDRLGATTSSTWGVFAAEAHGASLTASREPGHDHQSDWRLHGVKPWCSLAGRLSHALVTAHVDGERRLFAVALGEGVSVDTGDWAARGMPDLPSGPATFDDVPAVPVGEPGWYLRRPGFEWGGIRVAACWWGAAASVSARLREHAARRDSDLLHAAAGRALVHERSSWSVLRSAVTAIDTGALDGRPAAAAASAQLVRTAVRRASDAILAEAAQALGPAPAALDPWFAAQTCDLALYLLQDHGERDEARLGRLMAEAGDLPW